MRTNVSTIAVVVAVVLAAVATPVGVVAGTTQQDCSFPVTETDATGTEVTVEAEPERIVTLGPSAAQTMWEIGAKGRVVGVSQHASYLEGADERANVSGAGQNFVNAEKVVELEPDLVLAPDVVPDDAVAKLRESGLTVYKFDFAATIEDVYAKTELAGQLVGACEGASETVAGMDDRIGTVEEAVEGQDSPRVLYVFFGYTAGEGTFVHEIITAAGGTNVAAEAGISGYQQLSEETVVEQDPEWLVLNSDAPAVPQSDAYNSTTAVEEGQTVVVDANYVSQPAPRIVQPITELAGAFFPEAYAEANATLTPTATPSPTPEGQTSEPPTNQPTPTATPDGGQPGFTALLAALGVALAGLLVRRR
jgi:iron complex transport system substrate-binding protein